MAALAIFIGSTWDYVNDPIVGYLTDRTHWGRRRPDLLFGALTLWLVFWGMRERQEFMSQEKLGLRESIKAPVTNHPFVFGLLLFLFNGVTMAIIQVILLYYVKYVVQREPPSDLIMATSFVVTMLALPLWVWVSAHWDKGLAYILGIVFLAGVPVALASLTPQTGMPLIIILCVLAGIGVSAMHVMPWAIIPDAIEYGDLQSGRRNEGMFYSQITLAQKMASSIAVPLALQFSGYVPNSAGSLARSLRLRSAWGYCSPPSSHSAVRGTGRSTASWRNFAGPAWSRWIRMHP